MDSNYFNLHEPCVQYFSVKEALKTLLSWHAKKLHISSESSVKKMQFQVLRQYQLQGVDFLFTRKSALLADQMGLGKTVQAIVALTKVLSSSGHCRALIIVPSSLRPNWMQELEKWAPKIAVRPLFGDAEDRMATYALPIPVIISTYDQIRVDSQLLSHSRPFDLVILDEAQRIKNRNSRLSLACKIIPRKRSWALSGTPLENCPEDFLSIFNFVHIGLLHGQMSSRDMKDRAQPFFIRRTKRSVLPELPPIIAMELPIELSEQQRTVYDELWVSRMEHVSTNNKARTVNMLSLITALKQICNYDPETGSSAKFEALELILEESMSNSGRVIVFSQYVATLEWLAEKTLQYDPHVFHGGLSENERKNIVTNFQSNRIGSRLLYISLKAGGVGLNLGAADTVVLFDRWWNPAAENQAIERGHRFGRTTTLQVIRFLVRDSIEERIQKILSQKQELFDEFVDDLPLECGLREIDLHRVLGVPR